MPTTTITLELIRRELGPCIFLPVFFNSNDDVENLIESKLEGLWNAMKREAIEVRRFPGRLDQLPLNYPFYFEDVRRLFTQLLRLLKELEERRSVIQVEGAVNTAASK